MLVYEDNSDQTVFPIKKTCGTCKSVVGVEKTDIFFTPDVTGGRPQGRKSYICLCCGYANGIDVHVSTAQFTPVGTESVSMRSAPAPQPTTAQST